MSFHLLTNFNGVYSRNNLSKKNDVEYIINLGEYEAIQTHWIALHVNGKNVTYFDSFGVEHIPKEIRRFIRNKYIITNIYRIQAYDSIMRGYFYIEFIYFMLKGKGLLNHTDLFSPNHYERN